MRSPIRIHFSIAATCAFLFAFSTFAGLWLTRSMPWIAMQVDPISTAARYIDNVSGSGAADGAGCRSAQAAALEIERLLDSEGDHEMASIMAGRRALLLAEIGDFPGALEAAPDPYASTWLGVIYGGDEPPPPGSGEGDTRPFEAELMIQPSGWLSQRVEARIGGRDPDESATERSSFDLYTVLQWLVYGVAILAVLLSQAIRKALFKRRGASGVDIGSLDLRFGPSMRAFFVASALWTVPAWILIAVDPFGLLGMFVIPVASIVAIAAIGHLALWGPLGHRHPLEPPQSTIFVSLGMAITILALDLAIGDGIGALPWPDRFSPSWAEGVDDRLFAPESSIRMACAFDFLVWAPLSEEFLFRGMLFLGMRRKLGFVGAATVSSFLFSAVHSYSLISSISVFVGGVSLAYLFERSGSLWPSVVAHAGYNAIAIVAMQVEFG